MKEALNKFDQGGEGSEVDLGEVYDHLAYAEFQVCFHQRSGSSFSSQTSVVYTSTQDEGGLCCPHCGRLGLGWETK